MRLIKNWVEKRGVSGLSDEMCMVLLALPYGNQDFEANVAEKSFFGVRETLKFLRNFGQKLKYA